VALLVPFFLMAFDDTLLQGLNFFLPALVLPGLLVGLGRLARRRHALVRSLWRQWLCHVPLSCGVMLAGLYGTGQDGQMVTYAGLVLVSGSLQWILLQGWRAR
jgi:peptidoglycan/LPS O-acetylase OafA/YrhL